MTNLFINKKREIRSMKKLVVIVAAIALFTSCNCEQKSAEPQKSKADIVVETIMSRRSIRAYKPEPVKREQMDTILMCGINAPNGMNRQPWELRVIDNQELLLEMTEAFKATDPRMAESLKPGMNMFRNAPTVVFIAGENGGGQLECGLLGSNMMIAAESMGIGSCALGGPIRFFQISEGEPFLAKLGFSEGYKLHYAIGFGYKDEYPEAKPRDKSKIRYVD